MYPEKSLGNFPAMVLFLVIIVAQTLGDCWVWCSGPSFPPFPGVLLPLLSWLHTASSPCCGLCRSQEVAVMVAVMTLFMAEEALPS